MRVEIFLDQHRHVAADGIHTEAASEKVILEMMSRPSGDDKAALLCCLYREPRGSLHLARDAARSNLLRRLHQGLIERAALDQHDLCFRMDRLDRLQWTRVEGSEHPGRTFWLARSHHPVDFAGIRLDFLVRVERAVARLH